MGIRLSPFLAETEDPLLDEKPEWFLPHTKNTSYKILNVARSDVRDWLTVFVSPNKLATADSGQLSLRMRIVCCKPYSLLNSKVHEYNFIGKDWLQSGRGWANNDNLVVLPYLPAALPYVDAIGPCATLEEHWSDTYKLDIALQTQAHLYATGVLPYSGSVILENPKEQALSDLSNTELHARLLARLTAIALSGASMQLGNLPDNLTQDMIDLLKYVSPPLPHAAFEIGEQEDATTAIRYLPLKTKIGEWHFGCLFLIGPDCNLLHNPLI